MKNTYTVQKNWRAVGASEFDVFHRDTKKEINEIDTVGYPVELFSVVVNLKPDSTGYVICDCYARIDAVRIAKALRETQG